MARRSSVLALLAFLTLGCDAGRPKRVAPPQKAVEPPPAKPAPRIVAVVPAPPDEPEHAAPVAPRPPDTPTSWPAGPPPAPKAPTTQPAPPPAPKTPTSKPAPPPAPAAPRITRAQLRRISPLCGLTCTIRTVYVARAKALPAKDFARWALALDKATGARTDRASLVHNFPRKMSILFDETGAAPTFRADLSHRLLRRLGSIPPDQLGKWKSAVAYVLPGKAPDWSVPLTLAAADGLYDASDAYDPQKGAAYLRRFRGLAGRHVDLWTRTLGWETFADDAALSIILIDAFFPGGAFDAKGFEQALK